VLEHPVDDAGAVEAGHHGEGARNGAGGVAAVFLHPAEVQLDVWPGRGEWIEPAFGAPVQVGAQVGLGMHSRLAFEPSQIGGCGQPQRVETRRRKN
jgi:hypothetical protein